MLKFEYVENHEYYNDGYSCFIVVGNIPDNIIELAKEYDKENYLESCFEIEVIFDECSNEFHIGTEISDNGSFGNLFYVDIDGSWIYFDYMLNEQEEQIAFNMLKQIMAEEYGYEF